LPNLKKILAEKQKKVKSDLNTLPKSLADNPQANLLALCSRFVTDVIAYTSGKPTIEPDQYTFIRDALPEYKALRSKIEATEPKFNTKPNDAVTLAPPGTCLEEEEAISLEDVTRAIGEKSSRELPGIIPFSVHEYFIRKYLLRWKDLCLSSFDAVHAILKKHVERLTEKHFGQFKSSGLQYEAR
jgi:hypothetical protein